MLKRRFIKAWLEATEFAPGQTQLSFDELLVAPFSPSIQQHLERLRTSDVVQSHELRSIFDQLYGTIPDKTAEETHGMLFLGIVV
jgi:hypothetical protein